jgi:hypothetical protein
MNSLSFDLVGFLNIAISTLISTLIGVAITHYYYLKNTQANRILAELKKSFPNLMLPIVRPEYFTSESCVATLNPGEPPDKKIPHVTECRYSVATSSSGNSTKMGVLLKLIDLGYDLVNPNGLTVHNDSNINLPVVRLGFGYAEVIVNINKDVINTDRECNLTVNLKDTSGNTYCQNLKLKI